MSWTAPEEVAKLMVTPGGVQAGNWRSSYLDRALRIDAFGLLLAGALTLGLLNVLPEGIGPGRASWTYLWVTLGLIVLWLLIHRLLGVYDRLVVGEGAEEYRRVFRSAVLVFALATVGATASATIFSRAYLGLFFAFSTLVVVGSRRVHRETIARARIKDRGALNRVLVIGEARSARTLASAFQSRSAEGYRIVGVWWPNRAAHFGPLIKVLDEELPSYDATHTLADALAGSQADTVIVTDTELLGNVGLKELGWALEGTGIDLLVSPNVIDVAGPRVHIRPVANLPLIHLDEPRYLGAARFEKVLVDKVVAIAALIVASPVMLVIAALVKFGDGGPVFYRSERIGVGGVPFKMIKFRTMVVNADKVKDELTADSDSVLFKMKEDPRITKVGRVLRRFSLDELPQLFNVLGGSMSVVGPRPPLQSEVDAWEGGVERRLLVKQGMTGLWQVSGRSDLDWEDAVRLDIDYVENWSIARDLQIIWRTMRAVLSSDGAY